MTQESNQLTHNEIVRLAQLATDIRSHLSCNLFSNSYPCRTCRLAAVNDMEEYLEIHGKHVTIPLADIIPHDLEDK